MIAVSFRIRPAEDADFPAAGRLAVSSGFSQYDEAGLRRDHRSEGSLVLVADEVGPDPRPLLGLAVFERVGAEAELFLLAVADAARRRGLGRALLEAGERSCRAEGVTVLFLEVAHDNLPALALYERFGFEAIGRRRRYYPGGQDALTLRRWLRTGRPPGAAGSRAS